MKGLLVALPFALCLSRLLFTRYQHFVLPLRRRRERETGEIEGNRTRLRHPEANRSPSTNFRRLDARYKADVDSR